MVRHGCHGAMPHISARHIDLWLTQVRFCHNVTDKSIIPTTETIATGLAYRYAPTCFMVIFEYGR